MKKGIFPFMDGIEKGAKISNTSLIIGIILIYIVVLISQVL